MQIKATVRCHFIPTRTTGIRKMENKYQQWEEVENVKPLDIVGRRQDGLTAGEKHLLVPQKVENRITIRPLQFYS